MVEDTGNHFDTCGWYWKLEIYRKPRYLLNSNKLEKNSGEIGFDAKLQIETLTSNMLKRKDPSDKLSKKAKICPPKIKHFKCSDCGEDYTK